MPGTLPARGSQPDPGGKNGSNLCSPGITPDPGMGDSQLATLSFHPLFQDEDSMFDAKTHEGGTFEEFSARDMAGLGNLELENY